MGVDAALLYEFTRVMREADPPSVDTFLEANERFMGVGKIAIAKELIRYEHPMHTRMSINAEKPIEDHWYQYLWNQMRTVKLNDLTDNELVILTFNYDRSLENYLFTCIKNYYGVSDQEASNVMQSFAIIHLHGTLGNHPCMGGDTRPYNNEPDEKGFWLAVNSIKIIHEQQAESDRQFIAARNFLAAADYIMFLGFGYNKVNLKNLGLLRIQASGWPPKRIFGTIYDYSNEEITQLRHILPVQLEPFSPDYKCLKTLRQTPVLLT